MGSTTMHTLTTDRAASLVGHDSVGTVGQVRTSTIVPCPLTKLLVSHLLAVTVILTGTHVINSSIS